MNTYSIRAVEVASSMKIEAGTLMDDQRLFRIEIPGEVIWLIRQNKNSAIITPNEAMYWLEDNREFGALCYYFGGK